MLAVIWNLSPEMNLMNPLFYSDGDVRDYRSIVERGAAASNSDGQELLICGN